MTKIIGHRGYSGKYPENTLLSFKRAIAAGAQMVELDVRLSKDEELVVLHDLDLQRTTTGQGPVDSFSLAELKKFNAAKLYPGIFEPIPALGEVLALTNGKIQVNIELKEVARHKQLLKRLALELEKWGDPSQFLISAFEHDALKEFKRIAPQYETAILYGDEADPIGKAKAVGASALHPSFEKIDGEGIKAAHKEGLMVNVWTVNDKDTMKRFLEWGVDGIITDFPDRLAALKRA